MNPAKRAGIVLQVGIFLLGISGSLYAALTPANSMLNWFNSDDAFFYFQVARNVVAGHGFTFDQINLTNGFHPLWMVICLGTFWISQSQPLNSLRLIIIVSGLLNGLTGVCLYQLLRKRLHPMAAVIAPVIWVLLPVIFNSYTVQGMESGLSTFFIVLYLLKGAGLVEDTGDHSIRNLSLFGLLAAFVILSRLDNLFVVAAVGFFVVFRITRIRRLVIYDLVAILVAAILAWLLRFGTTPVVLNNYSIYPLMITGMMLMPLIFYLTGLYSGQVKARKIRLMLRLAISAAASGLLIYGLFLLAQWFGLSLPISRSLLLLFVAFSIVEVGVIRLFYPSRSDGMTPWRALTDWLRHNGVSILGKGVSFSIPIALLVGGYMLINRIFFNSFMPVSGQVKAWWGTLPNTVYRQNETLVSLFGLAPGTGKSPWSLLTTIIGDVSIFLANLFRPASNVVPTLLFISLVFIIFIFLVVVFSRRDGYLARKSFSLLIPALIIGSFLQIAYYAAQGYVGARAWYWVAESLTLALLGAVISSKFFEKMRLWTKGEIVNKVLVLALAGTAFFLHTRFLLHQFPYRVAVEMEAQYLSQTKELEASTPEGSIIGMTGGGQTAFFIENRTLVNLDGLINSQDYFEALKNGTANEFLADLKLGFVFGNPYMLLESDPYMDIFSGRLIRVAFLPGPDNFTLYTFANTQ